MPKSSESDTETSNSETQPHGRLSRRDLLQAFFAIAFATVVKRAKIPTEEEVMAAYMQLSNNHAKNLEKYVEPVDSYPPGNWIFHKRTENPLVMFDDMHAYNGILPEKILEDQGIISFKIGYYEYISGDKRLLVHLGHHGQHAEGISKLESEHPIMIEKPDQLGAISVDSIHSFSAWQEFGNFDSGQNHESIDLSQVRPEIVLEIERDLTVSMGNWIQNMSNETVILATDLPMNEVVGWEVFFMAAGNPSTSAVFENLDPLKDSVELVTAAVAATTAADMIKNLFRPKMNRRDFFLLPFRVAKVSAVSAALMASVKPIIEFYKSHTNLLRHVDAEFIFIGINLKVREREPEHFLGRIETLIKRDPSEVSISQVFFALRDLTSSYKELIIAEDGIYNQDGKNDFMSVWGAYHDTKLGLFSTTKKYILDLIRRFNQQFGTKIDMCFTKNPENLAWQAQIERSILWTATTYKTNKTNEGRKIESAHLWHFPELEEIFRK